VYAALLYYHDNPHEFEEPPREREEVMAEIEDDLTYPERVTPPREE
jgi:hypothetical protein